MRTLLCAMLLLPSFAAAQRRTAPLSYVLQLSRPASAAGAANRLLTDDGARAWLRRYRPNEYPVLLEHALRTRDLARMAAAATDPRRLREAALARPDEPAALSLAGEGPAFRQAALDWDTLPE